MLGDAFKISGGCRNNYCNITHQNWQYRYFWKNQTSNNFIKNITVEKHNLSIFIHCYVECYQSKYFKSLIEMNSQINGDMVWISKDQMERKLNTNTNLKLDTNTNTCKKSRPIWRGWSWQQTLLSSTTCAAWATVYFCIYRYIFFVSISLYQYIFVYICIYLCISVYISISMYISVPDNSIDQSDQNSIVIQHIKIQ